MSHNQRIAALLNVENTALIEHAAKYLTHYGYLAGAILSPSVSPIVAYAILASSISAFQKAAGLSPSGILNEETVKKMKEPRCGCLDVQRISAETRWRKNRLTYFIKDYVTQLSKADQDDLIKEAWKSWEGHADIQLTRVNQQTADIVISTGQGRNEGFDGPSGTLAYAYLPNGTDQQLIMRFDLSETWGKDSGVRFLNVAAHEFGHLLGLDHSRVASALMAPFYNAGIAKPQPNDDIPRIHSLYGSPKAIPTPTEPEEMRITLSIIGKTVRIL